MRASQRLRAVGSGASKYTIDLYHAEVLPVTSMRRVWARYLRGGRYVPPEYALLNVREHPSVTYDRLKEMKDPAGRPMLRRWVSYDNDVPKGTQARIRDKGGNWRGQEREAPLVNLEFHA